MSPQKGGIQRVRASGVSSIRQVYFRIFGCSGRKESSWRRGLLLVCRLGIHQPDPQLRAEKTKWSCTRASTKQALFDGAQNVRQYFGHLEHRQEGTFVRGRIRNGTWFYRTRLRGLVNKSAQFWENFQGDGGGPLVCRHKDNSWFIAGIEIGQSSHCGQVSYKNIFLFYSTLFRLRTSVCRRFSHVSRFSKIGSTKWFTRPLQFRSSRSLLWLQTALQLCKKLIFSYLSLQCIILQSTENLKNMSTKNYFFAQIWAALTVQK